MESGRILVVEDDPDVGAMLRTYFESQGFEVAVAARGEEALSLTRHSLPQLIVLDIILPDMDGYEICRRLRASSRTGHIPILFLTQRDERRDRIAGLELGADDYITKPFDIEELRLRVQNAIARAERENLTDPRTGLPASRQIEARLKEILPRKDWSMLTFRLLNFDSYRAAYGDSSGDEFLRFAAELILQTVDECGAVDDFIGYSGGDSFVVITEEKRAAGLETQLKSRFTRAIPNKYSYLDQQRGYVAVPGPGATEKRAPLIRLTVGVIRASQHNFTDVRQITELSALAGRADP
ncbi:MAG: response regulator [Anaerolineales bacterium]|nr:response regulator [Anaerolineales bacterium]